MLYDAPPHANLDFMRIAKSPPYGGDLFRLLFHRMDD